MGLALLNERWIEVKGHHILHEAKRVEAHVGLVDLTLNFRESGRHLAELGHRGAINLLNASVGRVWIDGGKSALAATQSKKAPCPARLPHSAKPQARLVLESW